MKRKILGIIGILAIMLTMTTTVFAFSLGGGFGVPSERCEIGKVITVCCPAMGDKDDTCSVMNQKSHKVRDVRYKVGMRLIEILARR